MTSTEIAAQLREAIDEGMQLFARMDDARTAVRPKRDGWSAREIVGHLIDSACNNHRRFVTGQTSATLVFDGYEQDEWVRRQRYNEVPWADLVVLWSAYNRHLAHVIASAGDEVITRPVAAHNFHEVLLEPIAPGEPAMLAMLMSDYVKHLRHHLAQVRSAMAA